MGLSGSRLHIGKRGAILFLRVSSPETVSTDGAFTTEHTTTRKAWAAPGGTGCLKGSWGDPLDAGSWGDLGVLARGPGRLGHAGGAGGRACG